MDSQRALLDSLMGVNRNSNREQDKVKDYNDSRICKNYMLGLCLHDLFGNTKLYLGQCSKFHTKEFTKDLEKNVNDLIHYENLLERDILVYILEVNRKIKRARDKLEADLAREYQEETNPQLLKLNADIMTFLEHLEIAGDSDNIDYAMDLMGRLETLFQERVSLMAKLSDEKLTLRTSSGAGWCVDEKLRVCDVCGAYLSIYDNDQKLYDHFVGSLHLSYQTMRYKLEEIYQSREQRRLKEYLERKKNRLSFPPNMSSPPSSINKKSSTSLNNALLLQSQSQPQPQPQPPPQPQPQAINSDKGKENGSRDEKREEKGNHPKRPQQQRSRSHSRSRSNSIGSLGSDSSAIMRRRRRRAERSQERERERELRKKRSYYRDDWSDSEREDREDRDREGERGRSRRNY